MNVNVIFTLCFTVCSLDTTKIPNLFKCLNAHFHLFYMSSQLVLVDECVTLIIFFLKLTQIKSFLNVKCKLRTQISKLHGLKEND